MTVVDSSVRATDRWRGALGVASVVAAVGALTATPPVVLAGVVIGAVAVVGQTTGAPSVELTASRDVSPVSPSPGDTATVTLSVRNDGADAIADCRVRDGVPDAMPVVEGTPRLAASLASGATASTSYEVVVPQGDHAFDAPAVAVRDATASTVVDGRLAVESTAVSATQPLPDVPSVSLGEPPSGRPGRVPSDDAGDGLAFDRVREHRRGDSLARVDWRRYARTRELTTVEYREDRSPTVVLVVDARRTAYVAPRSDATDSTATGRARDGVGRSVRAARHLAGALGGTDGTARVGAIALAPDYPTVEPSTGRHAALALGEFLDAVPGLSSAPPVLDASGAALATAVRARIPPDATVCVCSPAVDDRLVDAARRVEASGHNVALCSPDPTRADPTSAGDRLATLERRTRLRRLRRSGISVVDWQNGPLDAALASAGWSR